MVLLRGAIAYANTFLFVNSDNVQVHPSDGRIAAVILEIADFMLEFSTLGHEEAADIPQFVHPRIPNEVRKFNLSRHPLHGIVDIGQYTVQCPPAIHSFQIGDDCSSKRGAYAEMLSPMHQPQDLGSLGVPFLSIDEDGRSVLNKPQLTETKEDDKPAGVDQPPKPNEDFPDCTTYFYHRWMWIQVGDKS